MRRVDTHKKEKLSILLVLTFFRCRQRHGGEVSQGGGGIDRAWSWTKCAPHDTIGNMFVCVCRYVAFASLLLLQVEKCVWEGLAVWFVVPCCLSV